MMFDFNGLLLKLQQHQESNKEIRHYHTLLVKAAKWNTHCIPFVIDLENPYPISITYSGGNQLFDDSIFDNNTTYTFRDKEYLLSPKIFVERVVISSNVKSIPNQMFKNFFSLKTVTFEEGSNLQHIGLSCFENCHCLKEIKLPDTLNILGPSVFKHCYWLSTVNMESCNLQQIAENTFHNCYNMKRISFPSSLNSIQNCSFKNCSGLTFVSLPEYFESFGLDSMLGCSSLKVLYLPSNILPENFDREILHPWNAHARGGTIVPKFDKNLILLFDKVDRNPVQWGTVTFGDGHRSNIDADTLPNVTPYINLFVIGQFILENTLNANPSVEMNHLRDNSDGFRVAVDKYQMSILHILCHFPSNCDQVYWYMNQLIQKCPLMIECLDKTGRTALHHLIEFNPKREPRVVHYLAKHTNRIVLYAMIQCKPCVSDVKMEIIETIACANPEVLSAEDEKTGLMPFMFACMGEEYNLSVAYKLLLKMPDYLKHVV